MRLSAVLPLGAVLLFLIMEAGGAVWAEEVPVVPTDHGRAVRGVLYARPFALEKPYTYEWSREKLVIDSGYILVLEVDREYARPREVNVPVLYVGPWPAELANVGYESGHLIAVVPGLVDPRGVPIFFGSLELPERVDRERGLREMEAARAIGIAPFAGEGWEVALRRGGETLRVRRVEELYLAIAHLIMEYSPSEAELAETYRVPFIRR